MAQDPIIVGGGSVSVEIPKELADPSASGSGKKNFKIDDENITRVQITGSGIENYDKTTTDGKCTIKIWFDKKRP